MTIKTSLKYTISFTYKQIEELKIKIDTYLMNPFKSRLEPLKTKMANYSFYLKKGIHTIAQKYEDVKF